MTGRAFRNYFHVASLIMLLVAVGLLAALATMHFAIHGAEVKIPPLKGMTVAEARSQTSGLGLNLDVDNRYYSADVAAGHILTQSPPPGTEVRREWRVRVAESLGQQKVDVPDTVGKQERWAVLELRRAGLDVGVTARMAYGNVSPGTVLAQDPPAHAQGIAQPSVDLLVAAPAEAPDGFLMPDLSGIPALTAQAMLAKVGIKIGPLVYVNLPPVQPVGSEATPPKLPLQPGSVLAQDPQPGVRVEQSKIVKLTVAK